MLCVIRMTETFLWGYLREFFVPYTVRDSEKTDLHVSSDYHALLRNKWTYYSIVYVLRFFVTGNQINTIHQYVRRSYFDIYPLPTLTLQGF